MASSPGKTSSPRSFAWGYSFSLFTAIWVGPLGLPKEKAFVLRPIVSFHVGKRARLAHESGLFCRGRCLATRCPYRPNPNPDPTLHKPYPPQLPFRQASCPDLEAGKTGRETESSAHFRRKWRGQMNHETTSTSVHSSCQC